MQERNNMEGLTEIIGEIKGMKKNIAFEICSETCYFAMHLSKMFKKVYTIAISHEIAEKIHEKLEKEGIRNVGIIVASEPLEIDFKIDLALFSHLTGMANLGNYMQFAKKAEFVILAEWNRTQLEAIIQFFEKFEVLNYYELPPRYFAVLKQKRC